MIHFKFLFFTILAAILILTVPSATRAQSGGIQGQVMVKQADGSTQPAPKVLVELYRLDIKGYYKIKTDKHGRFAHIGLPYGRYAIILSGDGLNPFYEYNVRIPPGGNVEKEYEMLPGNGQRLTLKQVQQHQAQAGQGPIISEEERQKQLEEAQKRQEEQKKAAARDEDMIKHFDAAKELASNSQYEPALNEYKQALAASPDHPQLYVVMGKMAEAYFNLGVQRNNSGQRRLAMGSFALAAETAKKAADKVPADKADQKPAYLKLYCQALGVSARFDNSKLNDAAAAYQELIDLQISEQEKLEAKNELAKMYIDTGQTGEAVTIFRKILETDPKNLDALYGLGQALAASPDPSSYPEAVKVLEQFVKQAAKDKEKADKVEQAKSMAVALKEFIKQQK